MQIQQVEDRLRATGIKPTNQRMEIGQLLLVEPQHVSADQILALLQKRGSKVSKATVYNTLKLFTEQGLVREVSVDPTRQYYDSSTHVHHHFYNVDTGELTDIGASDLNFSDLPNLPAGTETENIEVVVRVRNKS